PTEWTPGTKAPDVPMAWRAPSPTRAITVMDCTTYGESVISMPAYASLLPIGPIEYGTTYMVRPRMHPSYSSRIILRVLSGSAQLLVGPTSSLLGAQMTVCFSTRATSPGSDRAKYELGLRAGFNLTSVPARTMSSTISLLS